MKVCNGLIAKGQRYRNRLNHNSGAFGEYIIVKQCVQMKIPNMMSFEQGATLEVGTVTCVR